MKNNKANVLVIGGNTSQSISIIRSIGALGFKLSVLSDKHLSPGFYSRYTYKKYYSDYRSKILNEGDVFELINNIIINDKIDFVFTVEEKIIKMLHKHKDKISGNCTCLIPEQTLFDKVLRKEQTVKLFKDCGFKHPKSIAVNTRELTPLFGEMIFPVIVKQSFKSNIKYLNESSLDYVVNRKPVLNVKDLQVILSNIIAEDPLIVQEYITGSEGSVMFVADNGCLRSTIQSVYTAEILRGLSISRKSIAIDKELYAMLSIFCKNTNWVGVGGLDYIKTESGYYILECNGRFTASTNLSLCLGIDLPRMHLEAFTNKNIYTCNNRITEYESELHDATLSGLTWWLLYVILGKVKHSDGKLDALLYYASFFVCNKRNFDMFLIKDPVPAFIEVLSMLSKPFTLLFDIFHHRPE